MKTPKYFYRVTESGEPVPGTLARLDKKPITGKWKQIKSVCCTEACPDCEPLDTTPGDTFSLRYWSNGVTEDVDVVSATNSSSVVGNQITLYTGQTHTIAVIRVPNLYGYEPYEQLYYGQGAYNTSILDYAEDPEDSNYWLVTISIEFYPYAPYDLLIERGVFVQNNLPIDDVFVTIDSTVRLFNSQYRVAYQEHSVITYRFEFTAPPSTDYDIKFYWNNVLVHSVTNQSSQNLSIASTSITGFKFDKVTIDPSPIE